MSKMPDRGWIYLSLLLVPALAVAEEPVRVSEVFRDQAGFNIHNIESPYQAGTTQLRVLLPDNSQEATLNETARFPVVYVLPVEAKRESRYGDGLVEVQKQNLHNKHKAIFVAPTFSHLPWYADHPTDLHIRQESYFLKVVVPLVDKTYPTIAKPEGRLLLGFSKSGWGAWSLLLRHPDVFGRAVAWDSPLNKSRPDQFGMEGIFGTQQNFEPYQISQLLREKAKALQTGNRLILMGYDNESFRQQTAAIHEQLLELKIPHPYRDGPKRKHDWHSGWVPEGVELLFAPAE